MCPSLIEIGSKTAEKNSTQTNRQTLWKLWSLGHEPKRQVWSSLTKQDFYSVNWLLYCTSRATHFCRHGWDGMEVCSDWCDGSETGRRQVIWGVLIFVSLYKTQACALLQTNYRNVTAYEQAMHCIGTKNAQTWHFCIHYLLHLVIGLYLQESVRWESESTNNIFNERKHFLISQRNKTASIFTYFHRTTASQSVWMLQ